MPFYDYSCAACGEEQTLFLKTIPQTGPEPPTCSFGHGQMGRDMGKGSGKIAHQEKGVFPYYDIQTDRTYGSYREFTGEMNRRGLRPIERGEMSDRNREIASDGRKGRRIGR